MSSLRPGYSYPNQWRIFSDPHDIEFWNRIAREHVDRKLRANPHLLTVKKPKNVILFIGDGMGISTVTSARINKNQKAGNPYLNEPLFFERFATAGMVKTSSFSHHVTDSAAGAMALLTGRKWGIPRYVVGLSCRIPPLLMSDL
ncbi:hypothetical protein ANCDUO_08171 [Ancylostoma duodenale]|uniref:alkaline phosphatase n=1 Tax=Ancylostoma duodenale TaxID=51022 RepID=A0A0C2GWQ0_9BILA|nr:hypothetical protein ANCDUO_08171 [Ancylostoma duodenale]